MDIYLEVIALRDIKQIRDKYGSLVDTVTSRDVYATTRSVYMRETYEAMAHGLKPEIAFQLSDCLDYQDEPAAAWNGQVYRVIRTEQRQEDKGIALICERLVNGAEVYAYGDA